MVTRAVIVVLSSYHGVGDRDSLAHRAQSEWLAVQLLRNRLSKGVPGLPFFVYLVQHCSPHPTVFDLKENNLHRTLATLQVDVARAVKKSTCSV